MNRPTTVLVLVFLACLSWASGGDLALAQLPPAPPSTQTPSGKYLGTMKHHGPEDAMIKIYDKKGHLQGMRDAKGNIYDAQGKYLGTAR